MVLGPGTLTTQLTGAGQWAHEGRQSCLANDKHKFVSERWQSALRRAISGQSLVRGRSAFASLGLELATTRAAAHCGLCCRHGHEVIALATLQAMQSMPLGPQHVRFTTDTFFPIRFLGFQLFPGPAKPPQVSIPHADLGCTVRTARAVNVGHAGAKSAVNTGAATFKFWYCQKGGGRQFKTFLP